MNNLKQIGIGLHDYHDVHGVLPPGLGAAKDLYPITPGGGLAQATHDTIPSTASPTFNRYASWCTWILPHVEQDARFKAMRQTAKPNGSAGGIVPLYICPSEPRGAFLGSTPVGTPHNIPQGDRGPTFYVGVAGTAANNTKWPTADGMLYNRSKTRLTDVTDGTSVTLMVGERPPSPIFDWGWWDSATKPLDIDRNRGVGATWDMDVVLGVAEVAGSQGVTGPQYYDEESIRDAPCVGQGSQSAFPGFTAVYQGVGQWPCSDSDCGQYRGTPSNFCDFFHFWSSHLNGALFCFGDGAVRFIPYTIPAARLKALATRAGGEPANSADF